MKHLIKSIFSIKTTIFLLCMLTCVFLLAIISSHLPSFMRWLQFEDGIASLPALIILLFLIINQTGAMIIRLMNFFKPSRHKLSESMLGSTKHRDYIKTIIPSNNAQLLLDMLKFKTEKIQKGDGTEEIRGHKGGTTTIFTILLHLGIITLLTGWIMSMAVYPSQKKLLEINHGDQLGGKITTTPWQQMIYSFRLSKKQNTEWPSIPIQLLDIKISNQHYRYYKQHKDYIERWKNSFNHLFLTSGTLPIYHSKLPVFNKVETKFTIGEQQQHLSLSHGQSSKYNVYLLSLGKHVIKADILIQGKAQTIESNKSITIEPDKQIILTGYTPQNTPAVGKEQTKSLNGCLHLTYINKGKPIWAECVSIGSIVNIEPNIPIQITSAREAVWINYQKHLPYTIILIGLALFLMGFMGFWWIKRYQIVLIWKANKSEIIVESFGINATPKTLANKIKNILEFIPKNIESVPQSKPTDTQKIISTPKPVISMTSDSSLSSQLHSPASTSSQQSQLQSQIPTITPQPKSSPISVPAQSQAIPAHTQPQPKPAPAPAPAPASATVPAQSQSIPAHTQPKPAPAPASATVPAQSQAIPAHTQPKPAPAPTSATVPAQSQAIPAHTQPKPAPAPASATVPAQSQSIPAHTQPQLKPAPAPAPAPASATVPAQSQSIPAHTQPQLKPAPAPASATVSAQSQSITAHTQPQPKSAPTPAQSQTITAHTQPQPKPAAPPDLAHTQSQTISAPIHSQAISNTLSSPATQKVATSQTEQSSLTGLSRLQNQLSPSEDTSQVTIQTQSQWRKTDQFDQSIINEAIKKSPQQISPTIQSSKINVPTSTASKPQIIQSQPIEKQPVISSVKPSAPLEQRSPITSTTSYTSETFPPPVVSTAKKAELSTPPRSPQPIAPSIARPTPTITSIPNQEKKPPIDQANRYISNSLQTDKSKPTSSNIGLDLDSLFGKSNSQKDQPLFEDNLDIDALFESVENIKRPQTYEDEKTLVTDKFDPSSNKKD